MRNESDTIKNGAHEIVRLRMDELTLYTQNAKRHPAKQVRQIANSIERFGDNVPIGVWGANNVIVDGHGRYLAKKLLGHEYADCLRLDHMTDDERKAYTLAVNKVALNSGLDDGIVQLELQSIVGIDMADFGFKPPKVDVGYYGDERERTNDAYNLSYFRPSLAAGDWQIPKLARCDYIPKDLIGFNYALTSPRKNVGVHFFLDDYQFERVWNQPEKYARILAQYDCVLTPDFSLYMDMPRCMKLWNIYRSRLIGQIWQDAGMKVIPTMSWAETETFEFCFEGIPQGGAVAVSTVGVLRDKTAREIWRQGTDEMMRRIQPQTVILYGKAIDYDWGKTKVVSYQPKAFAQ